MGLGDLVSGIVDDVASAGEHLVEGAEQVAGTVVDDGAQVAGAALDTVGLHGAAQTVERWGEQVADQLGDAVPERQLGETTDPTELIHGAASALDATVAHLKKFATAFGETAQGLRSVDTAHWVGAAAEAFRAKFAPHPTQWLDAEQACANAAAALGSYASTVRWAQGQAQQAITLNATGQRATQQAQARYQQAVEGYRQAVDAYNAAVSAGRNPGVRPAQPGAFADPGQPDRQRAEELLSQARQHRDAAGNAAQAAISAATGLAPAEPSFGRRLLDNVGDTLKGMGIAGEHLLGGVAKGVFGIVSFVRSLNPLDPYNITHPAEYVDGVSATAAGLVHAALHPTALVQGLVGSGWGSDPAEALGKLIPNLALAALTDGAGAAERAGLDAAEASGARAVREAAGDPVDNARSPAQMTCRDDPVDVASGHVVLPQTDVELAGVLPLVVERTHVSAYRVGRWYGPSWASTLDQRLAVDADGVLYTAPDGVVLCYPHPGVDAPVLPVEGARWPLTRTEDGGYTITDPHAGRTLHFARWLGGCWPITTITNRTGGRMSVGYDEAGAPLEIAHHGGYRIRVETSIGRVTGLWLVGGGADGADVELVRYGYSGGRLSEVTNSSGQALRFGYDQVGRLTEWVDRNDTWYRYSYDVEGRCVQVAGADGFLAGSFEYDPKRRVTTHTDALGAVSRFEFDERLRVIAETDPLWNTTRSEWDRYGRLTRRTDPLGRVSRYSYDEVGNLLRVIRPDGSQVVAEYNGLNLPTLLVDADGAVWRHEYDEAGNRVISTDPAGFTTHYRYDQRGYLVAITDAVGHTSEVATNAAGLPVAVTDPTGATTRYGRDGFGRVTEVTDPVGGVTRLGWTVEGKPAWRTVPSGSTERWSYDGEGNLIEYLDPLGQATRTEYTHFDLPAARTMPDGARLEYQYDPELRLVSVTNPQGPNAQRLVWRYDYDPAGRLVRETDLNDRVLRYTYDAAGQLVERVNGAGQAVGYVHDPLGNVIEQRTDEAVTRFGYDPAGRLVRATNPDCELTLHRDPLGRITAETCNGRTLTTRYDPLGRTIHRRAPSGVTSDWDYDAAGHPTTLRTAGRTLTFSHDPAGREVERRLAAGAGATDASFLLAQTWSANHQLTSQTLVGGEFAPRPGQPAPAGARAARMLQRRGYVYRPDGHLIGIDDQLSGPRSFELDAAGRVTAVVGPRGAEHYSYDLAGNISTAEWPTTPDAQGMLGGRDYIGTLIKRAGNIRYQHDPQGRVVVRHHKRRSARNRTWRYSWDAHDQLVGVLTPDGTHWRYRYDPLGRRIAKQRLGPDRTVVEHTEFVWDGNTLAEQTHNNAQTTTWDYEPGSHRPVTQTEHDHGRSYQRWVDQRFYAIVTDLIGTPTELIDANGTIAWHAQSTLWGVALARRTYRADIPLRFPGQYHDPETGLHYNHHRYYDPSTGRYTTPDPLGLAPAPNPHTYVSNPHHHTDPLGLAPCTPNIVGANYAQTTYREVFSRGGFFSGQTIDDVAGKLQVGGLTPRDVPISVITRDGNTLILDTRSSQALTRAGIPRVEWNVIDRTGNQFYEKLLDGQLSRNGLTSAGTPTVRSTG